MRRLKVEKAVGMILAHDITKIVPGEFKGVAFRRGHLISQEDIPELLKLGKRHVFVENLDPSRVHEEEAALRIAKAISGEGVFWDGPKEGRINIKSSRKGLLKVDSEGLLSVNMTSGIIVSTLKDNFPCGEGQVVAATRIIPLTMSNRKIERLEWLIAKRGPIVKVLAYRSAAVGAVVTGSELAQGMVRDAFEEYVGQKIEDFGCVLKRKVTVGDDPHEIARAIRGCVQDGCDLILTTGGLSVDPDDRTRQGIRKAGAKILFYGSPVLPGAMFLLAELGPVTVMGLPACVFYHKTTMFDLILARFLAGEKISRRDVAFMGHGGLCLGCETCRFPACSFGR